MRYIDADAVVWEIEKDKCGLEDYDSALDVAIAEIKTFKTAEVVEVVRCKDCKHARVHDYALAECQYYCTLAVNYHTKDFFCALGER